MRRREPACSASAHQCGSGGIRDRSATRNCPGGTADSDRLAVQLGPWERRRAGALSPLTPPEIPPTAVSLTACRRLRLPPRRAGSGLPRRLLHPWRGTLGPDPRRAEGRPRAPGPRRRPQRRVLLPSSPPDFCSTSALLGTTAPRSESSGIEPGGHAESRSRSS